MSIHSKSYIDEQENELRKRFEALLKAMRSKTRTGVELNKTSHHIQYPEGGVFHEVNAGEIRVTATDLGTFVMEIKKRLVK